MKSFIYSEVKISFPKAFFIIFWGIQSFYVNAGRESLSLPPGNKTSIQKPVEGIQAEVFPTLSQRRLQEEADLMEVEPEEPALLSQKTGFQNLSDNLSNIQNQYQTKFSFTAPMMTPFLSMQDLVSLACTNKKIKRALCFPLNYLSQIKSHCRSGKQITDGKSVFFVNSGNRQFEESSYFCGIQKMNEFSFDLIHFLNRSCEDALLARFVQEHALVLDLFPLYGEKWALQWEKKLLRMKFPIIAYGWDFLRKEALLPQTVRICLEIAEYQDGCFIAADKKKKEKIDLSLLNYIVKQYRIQISLNWLLPEKHITNLDFQSSFRQLLESGHVSCFEAVSSIWFLNENFDFSRLFSLTLFNINCKDLNHLLAVLPRKMPCLRRLMIQLQCSEEEKIEPVSPLELNKLKEVAFFFWEKNPLIFHGFWNLFPRNIDSIDTTVRSISTMHSISGNLLQFLAERYDNLSYLKLSLFPLFQEKISFFRIAQFFSKHKNLRYLDLSVSSHGLEDYPLFQIETTVQTKVIFPKIEELTINFTSQSFSKNALCFQLLRESLKELVSLIDLDRLKKINLCGNIVNQMPNLISWLAQLPAHLQICFRNASDNFTMFLGITMPFSRLKKTLSPYPALENRMRFDGLLLKDMSGDEEEEECMDSKKPHHRKLSFQSSLSFHDADSRDASEVQQLSDRSEDRDESSDSEMISSQSGESDE